MTLIYAFILFLGSIVSCIVDKRKETELKTILGFYEGEFKIKAADIKADKEWWCACRLYNCVLNQLCLGHLFLSLFCACVKSKNG